MNKKNLAQWLALIASAALWASHGRVNAAEPGGTNSFPSPNEIFRGRSFTNKFERDVFFLRTIRESYPEHWAPLLAANITVTDYVLAPDKLQRFIDELGAAMAGKDDLAAITNLAAITTTPDFYANTNAPRPDLQRAAASALIKIGPRGAQALASSFSEVHYRMDSASLEVLAEAVGKSGTTDPKLTEAL